MNLIKAFYETVKDRRVLKWELGSGILYALPALVRFITRNPTIQILNAPYGSPSPFIPPNLVEKVLVNSFFPGGAGGVAGETLVSKYLGRELEGKTKYFARLLGAYAQCGLWTLAQYAGWLAQTIGPHGEVIAEGPAVYPFNFLMATLSVFTPGIVDYVGSKVEDLCRRIQK